MDVTRIIDLPSKTYIEEGDYIPIDNQQDGTQKVQFTNLLDSSLSQSDKIAPANAVGQQFTNTNAEINALRAAVGSPLKASTVTQMTDTNKIYVYTGSETGYTNGNWYYYNGTAWVSGGVYNSIALETDKTLTVSNMAADAKVVGDDITDLKSALTQIGDDGNLSLNLIWESGSVDGNGQPVNNGIRIRTKLFNVDDYKRIKVTPPSDGKVAFELYSSESSFIGEISFVTTETMQTMGGNIHYLRLLVGKTNNASITPDYGSNVKAIGVTAMAENLENDNLHINNLDYQNSKIYGFKSLNCDDFELGNASYSASAITYSEDLKRVRTKASSVINVKKGDYIYLTDYTDARFGLSIKYDTSSYETPTPAWITSGGYYVKHDGELHLLLTHLTEVVQTSVLGLLNLVRIVQPSMSEVSNAPNSWQIGTTNADGIVDSSAIRIVSNLFAVKKGTIISCLWDGDYDFTVIEYDMSLTHIADYGWKKIHHITNDCIIRMLMRKKTNAVITSGEVATIASDLQIVNNPTNYYYPTRDEGIRAVNHTGWYEAPPNTIPAYVESYEHGFKYIETDVNFTSDDVCVCLHDNLINSTARNPDGTEIEEEINITDITYEEALEYDFGIFKGEQYAGTKLPRLADVLALCKALNLQVYIDFKTSPELTKAQIESVVDIVENCGMKGRVIYIPAVPDYGHYIIRKDHHATIGYTYTTSETHVLIATSMFTGENAVFLNANYSLVDSAGIARCKSYNLPLEVYTIESTSDIDALDDYVTGVTSGSINVNEYLKSKYINA